MIKSVHVESGHLTSTDSSLGMRTLPSRRFSLLDTKESLTGSSTHTPLLSSLPDHVSSSLGHGQVVYCVRRETFVVQSKSDVPKVPVGCSEGPSRMFRRSQSDVPKVPVGCSEGPSRMFRRSQSDVPKVPVGCSEGPSRMFGRSQSDVWKSQMFGSSSRTFGDCSEMGLSPRTSSSWCFALLTRNSHTRPVQ